MFRDWHRVFGSKLQERQELDLRTAELWAMALQGLGMTRGMFKIAMQASIKLEWAPSTPRDFYDLATSEMTKFLPDMRTAYIEAANCNFTHGICYEVAKRVGFWDLSNKPEKLTYPLWKKHWQAVVGEFLQGQIFDLPKRTDARLNDKSKEPCSREQAMQYIENLKKQLAMT